MYLIKLLLLKDVHKFKMLNINNKTHKYLWYKQILQGVKPYIYCKKKEKDTPIKTIINKTLSKVIYSIKFILLKKNKIRLQK